MQGCSASGTLEGDELARLKSEAALWKGSLKSLQLEHDLS